MQESANLLSFRSVHLKHLLRKEGEQVVDDIGTLRIGGETVFHEAEDAVGLSFVEAELVERFGFFELMVAFVGRVVKLMRRIGIPELLLYQVEGNHRAWQLRKTK